MNIKITQFLSSVMAEIALLITQIFVGPCFKFKNFTFVYLVY